MSDDTKALIEEAKWFIAPLAMLDNGPSYGDTVIHRLVAALEAADAQTGMWRGQCELQETLTKLVEARRVILLDHLRGIIGQWDSLDTVVVEDDDEALEICRRLKAECDVLMDAARTAIEGMA